MAALAELGPILPTSLVEYEARFDERLRIMTACGGPDSAEPGCDIGMRARLNDAWYLGNGGIHVIPTYGDSLGMARVGGCGGTLGFAFEAFSIVGVSPEIAFASTNHEHAVFIAEGTHADLRWLPDLRREPACLARDERVSLEGPWLGILGPHHETEVDLVPPYAV